MLNKFLAFSEFLTAFARVERICRLPGTDRKENDAEHSFHLVLCAWYLIDSGKLSLDKEKVFRYALAHDLVEVYAGDTYIYDSEHAASKHEREAAAAVRLKEEFPEFPDLHESIAAYEKKDDPESRFVYALDKVLPLLVIREDKGRAWKERGVTLDMLVSNKTPKIALSPEVVPYFNELVELLRTEKIMAEHSGAPEA